MLCTEFTKLYAYISRCRKTASPAGLTNKKISGPIFGHRRYIFENTTILPFHYIKTAL